MSDYNFYNLGDIEEWHLKNIQDENKAYESVEFLYTENRNSEKLIQFIISKINDENCKDSGKFALLYYKFTHKEWVKTLMEERAQLNLPSSFTALQFTVICDSAFLTTKISDYEFYNQAFQLHKNAYRLFEKYLESDDEEIQFETIRLLFKISSPFIELKDIIMSILENPNHKFHVEIAMCCFPFQMAINASNIFQSSTIFTAFLCSGLGSIICLPCSLYTVPAAIYKYVQLRPLFFKCVDIMNSCLENNDPKAYKVAEYMLCLKMKYRIPEALHMLNYEKLDEIIKVERRKMQNEQFNIENIKTVLESIEIPKMNIREELEGFFKLDFAKSSEFYSRRYKILDSLERMNSKEIDMTRQIIFELKKQDSSSILDEFDFLMSLLWKTGDRIDNLEQGMSIIIRSQNCKNLDAVQLVAKSTFSPYYSELDMDETYFTPQKAINEFRKNFPFLYLHRIKAWLRQNRLSEDGISDSSISDYAILNVLIKMEFLNVCKHNIDFIERLKTGV